MKESIEEIQNNIPDFSKILCDLKCDLECAETCDNVEDFCENISSAIINANSIKKELTKMLKLAHKQKVN